MKHLFIYIWLGLSALTFGETAPVAEGLVEAQTPSQELFKDSKFQQLAKDVHYIKFYGAADQKRRLQSLLEKHGLSKAIEQYWQSLSFFSRHRNTLLYYGTKLLVTIGILWGFEEVEWKPNIPTPGTWRWLRSSENQQKAYVDDLWGQSRFSILTGKSIILSSAGDVRYFNILDGFYNIFGNLELAEKFNTSDPSEEQQTYEFFYQNKDELLTERLNAFNKDHFYSTLFRGLMIRTFAVGCAHLFHWVIFQAIFNYWDRAFRQFQRYYERLALLQREAQMIQRTHSLKPETKFDRPVYVQEYRVVGYNPRTGQEIYGPAGLVDSKTIMP